MYVQGHNKVNSLWVFTIAFFIIDYYWLTFFGTLIFALFIFAGIFPANIYYFSELQVRSKKDTILYLSSYLPAIIVVIVVILTWL